MKAMPNITDEELASALLAMERDGQISIGADGTVHLLTPEIEGDDLRQHLQERSNDK